MDENEVIGTVKVDFTVKDIINEFEAEFYRLPTEEELQNIRNLISQQNFKDIHTTRVRNEGLIRIGWAITDYQQHNDMGHYVIKAVPYSKSELYCAGISSIAMSLDYALKFRTKEEAADFMDKKLKCNKDYEYSVVSF